MNTSSFKNYISSDIIDKLNLYLQYINKYDLELQIFDPSKKRHISMDLYLISYFLFEKTGASYQMFIDVLNFGYYCGLNNKQFPKKSSLNDFKKKISSLQLNKHIHEAHINNNNKVTKSIISDTMFVENKNNSNIIGRSAYYKNKNGTKILAFCSSTGYPLYADIYKGNINDNEIFNTFLKTDMSHNLIVKNNVNKYISDKGFDSIQNRENLLSIGCEPIIPKNIRNNDNSEIKKIKKSIRDVECKSRKVLMINQKKLNLKAYELKKQLQANKNDDVLLAKYIEQFNATQEKITNIKKERMSLTKNTKLKIKESVAQFKKENKKECTCKYKCNECLFCRAESCCCVCNVCSKCGKNNSYYLGLTYEQVKIYPKRQKIEHLNSKMKNGRLMVIRDKSKNMFMDSVYCRFTDFIFFK